MGFTGFFLASFFVFFFFLLSFSSVGLLPPFTCFYCFLFALSSFVVFICKGRKYYSVAFCGVYFPLQVLHTSLHSCFLLCSAADAVLRLLV